MSSQVVSVFGFASLLLSIATPTPAQTRPYLTTIEALRWFSGFYNLEDVALRGELMELRNAGTHGDVTALGPTNGAPKTSDRRTGAYSLRGEHELVVLRGGDYDIPVMLNHLSVISGPVEVRGQFIDLGRVSPDDARIAEYDNKPDPQHWPNGGEDFVVSLTIVHAARPAPQPTVRALALEPWTFEGQSVTLTGQFGGRNMFVDLPMAPPHAKNEFVLRSAEGGVWVTGTPTKRESFVLTRPVSVTGVVRVHKGMAVVEAQTVHAVPPSPARTSTSPLPKQRGEVAFSSPSNGEMEVSPSVPIRIQFTRGIDPSSIANRIRITYGENAIPQTPPFEINYDIDTRSVQLNLSRPLEPFRTVKIEVLEGVMTFEGAAVEPWSITFTTGPSF
jgi:Big-like domain-containing protein